MRLSAVAPAPGGLERKLSLREERKEVGQQGRLVCESQAAYVTGADASKGVQGVPFGPVVKNPTSKAGTQVRSLVRELRSHMPRGNKPAPWN